MKLLKLLLICLLFTGLAQASDKAKEKRWADQIIDALLDGEAIWLTARGSKFLGIYTPAEGESSNTVIIMHGTGVHPNWAQVIQPLRMGLMFNDWNTLSIQMPVLDNEAKLESYASLYNQVPGRINAAVKYLKNKKQRKIVLAGHSMGSSMGAYYLSTAYKSIDGFIAIATPSDWKDPRMNTLKTLKKVRVPTLDIYGSEDKNIAKAADKRKSAFTSSGNARYKQVKVDGADHFFEEHADVLTQEVSDWMKSL